jgi:hypothetical protein
MPPGGEVRFWTLSAVVALAIFVFGALAAAPAHGAGASEVTANFTRPMAVAARISAAEAPNIDGDLADPAWAKATAIDQFHQKQPNPGEPPTERTVLRIMYDENNLYFGVYNYDSNPGAIIARSMQRDGPQYTADSIVIQLDPYRSHRSAYSFEVGASGGRTDEIELNNTQELTEWNAIWEARVRRVPDGWVAEIAIPFRSISYDPNEPIWGFDFSRRIRHKNERIYWSSVSPTLPFTDISQNGDLAGIAETNPGFGLDLQVYAALRARHDWRVVGDGAGLGLTAGGNAFYKITPALTDTLTVNPDFSDAPLDIRQVNTTRFSLFTPETRDFFLQDVAAFDFGGHNFARDSNDRANNNGRPFFSRNIGLVRGVPVSLIVGDKLSGQFADFDVGALSVLTDRTPASPGQVLSVLRMRHPVLSESKVGFIVTNGDPAGFSRNTVAGVDYQYRDSNFLGGYILESEGFYQRSFSNTRGDDDSAALSVTLPNEPWGGDFIFKQVGEQFFPALGFVNRLGIRQYLGRAYRLDRYRDTFLNQLEFGTDYEFVTSLGNNLESRSNDIYVRAASFLGDEVTVKLLNAFEDVPAVFFLPHAVPILPGHYDWTNIDGRVRSFDGRPVRIDWEVMCCSFYNGRQIYSKLQVAFRPNAYFEFVPTWEATFIHEPTGSVDIHILSLDSVINFIPDMQLALQAQFDNISRGFGFSVRYAWEYQPGNQILLAVGHSGVIPGTSFLSNRTQATFRLIHTFRF